MVAFTTFQEFFGTWTGSDDPVENIVRNIVTLPSDASLYSRSRSVRQFSWRQSSSYNGFLVLDLFQGGVGYGHDKSMLSLSVIGSWKSYVDGVEEFNGINVALEDFRTSKEAIEAVLNKFASRFQKPASQGNVKVYYDESKFTWCWKRPSSQSFIRDEHGNAFHVETCPSVSKIFGDGIVPDQYLILNQTDLDRIGSNMHRTIRQVGGSFYLKEALIPIYKNQIPFETIYTYVTKSSAEQYEFVMVNNERRYLNIKRSENTLLAYPIHQYNVRIEGLVPANKLFLFGKTDLYAKRDKSEVPFLGWELEAASNKSTVGTNETAKAFKEHMPWLIMCKHDGSISPEGFETVSVPATLDFWQESNLSSTLDTMRVPPHNMRSFEHSKCGFHVHVSRSALSVLDLQKLERFIHNPDNNKFIVAVAGRSAGQYQKYMPELFNDRKKFSVSNSVSSSGRYMAEDLQYYTSNFEEVYEQAQNYARRVSGSTNNMTKFQELWSFLNNFVSYDHLNRVRNNNESVLSDRYPRWLNWGMGDLYYDVNRVDPRYLLAICGGSRNGADHVAFLTAMFKEVLCVGRPKFSKLIALFFPEWELNTEIPEDSSVPSWKVGLLKSKAPSARKHSLKASLTVKGPVGKGVMSRYDALNTTNANTVEFRMFKGTMNGTTIMRYLEFVDALVRFVGTTSATDKGVHYDSFIRWLKSDSFNVARYEHLISFISGAGFLDRKEIRRKKLPDVISEDSRIEGIIASIAKGFEGAQDRKPLGVFLLTESSPSEEEEEEEIIASPPDYPYEGNDTQPDSQSSLTPAESNTSGNCSDPNCSICHPER